MFRNYFNIALRNFWKNRLITLINITGLAVGISAALVIYLIVQYHYNFDKFEPGRDRIYRIVSNIKIPSATFLNWGVPAPLPGGIQNQVPGIKHIAFFTAYGANIKVEIPQGNDIPSRVFKKQDSIIFTDKAYFQLIPYQWLEGNATTALSEPFQVVLAESRAKIYFPGIPLENIIGREILFNDSIKTTITGIVRDQFNLSDFSNKEFISLITIPSSGLRKKFNWENWHSISSSSQCLVLLAKNASVPQIEKQLNSIERSHPSPINSGDTTEHTLQPLKDVHFNSMYGGKVHKSTLYGLMLLALFLLILGSINFINLSTAQASQRTREVGIRKTLGSSRLNLMFQFLSEALLLTAAAASLSLILIPLILQMFSGFTPIDLHFNLLKAQGVILFTAILIISVTLMSGFYPAVILSRLQPVQVLKDQGYYIPGKGKIWLRKTLSVIQFVIAQVFIIGALVVTKQINFSLHQDMGFRKTAIINLNIPFDYFKPDNKKYVLLNKLHSISQIESISLGSLAPASDGSISESFKFNNRNKEMNTLAEVRNGDTNYIKVFRIKLLAGRNIQVSDSATAILINETYARTLGFRLPGDAVGHYLTNPENKQLPIIGVMADFNTGSTESSIPPLVFYASPQTSNYIHVALRPNDADGKIWRSAIASMQQAWKEVYPQDDFDYSFLDKNIELLYKQDEQLSKLLGWSAGIAIFISCLGMLGLVIFTANHRTKEIGIRKVLGASVVQIISLLSKDFFRLVALAFVIALPIAWWVTHKWLQNFAYHTKLSWWIFLISGMFMLFIALLIIGLRAGKTALANPVRALRSE